MCQCAKCVSHCVTVSLTVAVCQRNKRGPTHEHNLQTSHCCLTSMGFSKTTHAQTGHALSAGLPRSLSKATEPIGFLQGLPSLMPQVFLLGSSSVGAWLVLRNVRTSLTLSHCLQFHCLDAICSHNLQAVLTSCSSTKILTMSTKALTSTKHNGAHYEH